MDAWNNGVVLHNKDEDEVEWGKCLIENFDPIHDEMGLCTEMGNCDVNTIWSLFAGTPQGSQCAGVDYGRRNPGQNADTSSIAMLLPLPAVAPVKLVLPVAVATVLDDSIVYSQIDNMFRDYDGSKECFSLALCSDKSTRCPSSISSLASSNETNTDTGIKEKECTGAGASSAVCSYFNLSNSETPRYVKNNDETLEERQQKRLIKNRLSAQKSRNARMQQDLKNQEEIQKSKVEIADLHKKIEVLEFQKEETNKNFMILRTQNEALVRENKRLKCASENNIRELKTEMDESLKTASSVQIVVEQHVEG
jgi:hypothetical protein